MIEIDYAPNSAAAEKLVFACGAGAFPLWVDFGKGSIEKIDGVRGVLDAGNRVTACVAATKWRVAPG
ncbi:hypothetical protein ACIP98_42275 [Streptomyces sp. NPDC088354]|uniref:hypothetical protein n=1 Tax=Streptomyces sp. NPDC088354 TaxID=3365856 RepID=UPI00380B1A61